MLRIISKLSFYSLIVAITLFTFSCENTEADTELDTIVNVEEFTQEAVFRIDESASAGRGGCFEFVFPIFIEFGADNVIEIENYMQLKNAIKRWKESNPTTDRRPHLQYPIDVITNGGRLITVETPSELKQLKKLCDRLTNWPGHYDGNPCFILVYPVLVNFPNGESYEAPDGKHLKLALIKWKINSGADYDERPSLGYPLEVKQGDNLITLESMEELKQLKEDCRD